MGQNFTLLPLNERQHLSGEADKTLTSASCHEPSFLTALHIAKEWECAQGVGQSNRAPEHAIGDSQPDTERGLPAGRTCSKVRNAVVTLKSPKLKGGNLTSEVEVLEGNLTGASDPAAPFINHFAGFGGGFDRVGDYPGARRAYWHAPVYHGPWF